MPLHNRPYFLFAIISILLIGSRSNAQMYDDSLATDRHLQKISSTAFMNVILHATERDQKEPLDKLEQLGLYLDSKCDEICETYLKEKNGKGPMQRGYKIMDFWFREIADRNIVLVHKADKLRRGDG